MGYVCENCGEPEPVAWMYGGKLSDGADDLHISINEPEHGYKIPLYAEPPARKPLNDEEIYQIIDGADLQDGEELSLIDFSHAIEQAHGIIDKIS
jgi:hypothetical protein